jgi:4-carboxymuconolactone decarboxylase
MTRLTPPQQVGVLTRLILRVSRRKVAQLAGRETERMLEPLEAYARAPRLLVGYGMFEQATAKQTRVAPRLKVLAELKAATLTQCEYCIDIGSQIARRAGIGDDQLLALPRYRESELFDELEKLVLDYAVGMSRTPVAVSDELFAELKRRFDDAQLVELSNVIALENMRGRFNLALGIGASGFTKGMVCAVPEDAAGRERLGEAKGEPDARPAPPTAHPQPGSARAA